MTIKWKLLDILSEYVVTPIHEKLDRMKEIERVKVLTKKNNRKHRYVTTKAEYILKKHFTEEAQRKLKEIIVSCGQPPWCNDRDILGVTDTGIGAIRILSVNGIERTLVHEYVHIADELELIDRKEFECVYGNLRLQFPCPVAHIENSISSYRRIKDKLEERIARIGERIAVDPKTLPREMRKIYAKTLVAGMV